MSVFESATSSNSVDTTPVAEATYHIRNEINKVIVGQTAMIDLLMAALLTGGHVLIEGVPGIAKTLTARLLSRTISVKFSRIQFTPDLMPADLIGTSVFNMKTTDFDFRQGPVFTNFLLADEINRAQAKTQSALFEVMEERQITSDGTTYPMSFPFFVVATQNPIEQEGTYKLPEAQLDRFAFKIAVDYPELADEKAILHRFSTDFDMDIIQQVQPIISAAQLLGYRKTVESVHIRPELIDYIATLTHHTRHHSALYLGASPRASLAILKTSKAIAAMQSRNYVTPDDIRTVCTPVLRHRIQLTPDRELEGFTAEQIIDEIIQSVEVPR